MLVLPVIVALLCVHNVQSVMIAKANIHLDSKNVVIGHLIFAQKHDDSPVTIHGRLHNMTPNSVHGFHVHTNALSDGVFNCTAVGSHFNPYNTMHGSINADIMNRHVGDLGNVTSDSAGNIEISIKDSIIQLYNATQSIIDRTIVLHAMRDDGGMGGFADSNTTGNAGARIACGTIVLKKM